MYRTCIFCSADLGTNEAIEAFPVGRNVAFDAAKGRLWAVCRTCCRWNLAPLEERWEAVEEAERRFRDTRARAQRENIGLCKLPDGTRLVRVGEALAGELAAWRYADHLVRRRKRHLLTTGVGTAAAGVVLTAGMAIGGLSVGGAWAFGKVFAEIRAGIVGRRTLARLSAEEAGGKPLVLQRKAVATARLRPAEDGGMELLLHQARDVMVPAGYGGYRVESRDLVLRGDVARRVLVRAMVHVNAAGATREGLQWAVDSLAREESPDQYVARAVGRGVLLGERDLAPRQKLALEMALHEQTERRALEGELAMLQEMWRQAEEIASIADALPDGPVRPAHLPVSEAMRG